MKYVRNFTLSEVIKELETLEEEYGNYPVSAVQTLCEEIDGMMMPHMISIIKDGKNVHLHVASSEWK